MRFSPIAFIIVLCVLLSCKQNKDTRIVNKETGITGLEKDDPNFLRLMDTAQKYIPDFITSFKLHSKDTSYEYLIKSDFVEGEIHEHMWSSPISINGNLLRCVFTDSAINIHNIKHGDTANVKITNVEDWVIYDYGNQIKTGSFSESYLRGE